MHVMHAAIKFLRLWKFRLQTQKSNTVNSRFKKDLNLQIHLHKAFFSDNRFLDSYHKSFLNQTTLDLRKEKWSFLNREFTVQGHIYWTLHYFCNFMIYDLD